MQQKRVERKESEKSVSGSTKEKTGMSWWRSYVLRKRYAVLLVWWWDIMEKGKTQNEWKRVRKTLLLNGIREKNCCMIWNEWIENLILCLFKTSKKTFHLFSKMYKQSWEFNVVFCKKIRGRNSSFVGMFIWCRTSTQLICIHTSLYNATTIYIYVTLKHTFRSFFECPFL